MVRPEDHKDCRSRKQDAQKHLQTHIEINVLPMDVLHPNQRLARRIDLVLAALLQRLLGVTPLPAVVYLIEITFHEYRFVRGRQVDA